ncbi:hypothetical protein B1729_14575 [Microbacterium sp. B35-04]|uniref:hypothetical protein n=1 Tax=Microbacterium sp. B35-04 TaxID=1961716 RepID=UPI0013D361CD|nr:hypothetical protein [Microbacterium sp. B35-04]KAF2412534.1 hypothetical protein B1729_14575 [Microbacterium sp. B35-04]
MAAHHRLPDVVDAARDLAGGLINATLLLTLHRDIDALHGLDGRRLGSSSKQYALRWAIFTMTYAALEGFFNDVLRDPSSARALPLNPDKLRSAGERYGVRLFTNDWGVRTRIQIPVGGSRSRWAVYSGTQSLNAYLGDMKSLRDLLSHGQDPRKASNESGALWPLAQGGHSMRVMGAEGFVQAACDLAEQTILAFGGRTHDFPTWPEPARSGLSAEPRPALKLLP